MLSFGKNIGKSKIKKYDGSWKVCQSSRTSRFAPVLRLDVQEKFYQNLAQIALF